MPYKHIEKDGSCGSLNNSLTVRELYQQLGANIRRDPSILDKAVLLSDDEEGNCFHSAYYAITTNPLAVKDCLEASNWSTDDIDEVSMNAVIIG